MDAFFFKYQFVYNKLRLSCVNFKFFYRGVRKIGFKAFCYAYTALQPILPAG